ncbi:MAG: ribonuclease HII [Clostridiales bacterium]|nr:ribonuclease HII [Clostridiales bacterium]MCD7828631.1 ribonuclease HII [Clostridiales bacterium]
MTYEFENKAHEDGYKIVCGIDEAGRGPLAGPVFAAAVILPAGLEDSGINDSKKLSEKKREELFDFITENAVAYGIGSASEKEIDEINILNATFLAMKRAVENLGVKPDLALVDGNRKPNTGCEEITVVKGDSKSVSIAAASILAKVSRDRFMRKIAEQYPEYKFEQHKGYPTKLHYEMIEKYGVLPIHRKTFLKKIKAVQR